MSKDTIVSKLFRELWLPEHVAAAKADGWYLWPRLDGLEIEAYYSGNWIPLTHILKQEAIYEKADQGSELHLRIVALFTAIEMERTKCGI